MSSTADDLRSTIRTLSRRRGFAALVVAILGLGIGASTTVFSIVDQTLLRPAPFLHGDRLVDVLDSRRGGGGGNIFTPEKILGWQAQRQVFERFEAYAPRRFDLRGGDEPERILGLAVSVGLFDMLGVQPLIGRGFTHGDGRPGNERVVILSQRLVERRWGAAANVVGTRVDLSDEPHTVIGILPSEFSLLNNELAWVPVDLAASIGDPNAIGFYGVGRLPKGLTVAEAQVHAYDVADHLQKLTPLRRSWDIQLEKKRVAWIAAPTRTALFTLFGAVTCLLLIACFNVAHLLVTYNNDRQAELALRTALGAARTRIAGQILLESLVLALAGGVVGVVLASWGVSALLASAPASLVARTTAPIDVDSGVLAFACVVTVLTGVICGLLPAFRASRPNVEQLLRRGPLGSLSRSSGIVSSSFVVAGLAFSLMLLVGAVLMLRTVARIDGIKPGFEPKGLVAMNVDLPSDRYPTESARSLFFSQVRARLLEMAGIDDVAVAWGLTLGAFGTGVPEAAGGTAPTEAVSIATNRVSPEYFTTLRIPLLVGRTFLPTDRTDGSVIVNETLARQFWPDGQALGRQFRDDAGMPWRTVVGIVGDVDARIDASRPVNLQMYEPWPTTDRNSAPSAASRRRSYVPHRLIVRAADPVATIPLVKSAIWAIDRDQAVDRIALATDSLRETFARQRFVRWVMTIFAVIGAVLAAAGVFGVLSQAVALRTREIGIRMAVGASPAHIVRLIMARGGVLIAAGIGIGAAGAAGLARSLDAILYQVPARDPVSFGTAAILLAVVGLLASWVPVRRAVRVDPATAIRVE